MKKSTLIPSSHSSGGNDDKYISQEAIDVLGYGMICIYMIIYVPLLVFYGRKYYKNRNHIALKQRYALLTIIELVLSFFELVLQSVRLLTSENTGTLKVSTVSVVVTCDLQLIWSLWIWRYWMIYVNMRWNLMMTNKKWMHIINPHTLNLITKHWIVTKRNTLGNMKWFGRYVILPSIIIWYIPISLILFFYASQRLIKLIWLISIYVIPWFILFAIYYSFPLFRDNFFISQELMRLLVVFTFLAIADIAFNFIDWIFAPSSTNHVWHLSIMLFLFMYLSGLIIAMMIATKWVLKKVKNIVYNKKNNKIFDTIQYNVLPFAYSDKCHDVNSAQAFQLKQIFKN
eukprot:435468_1